MKESIHIDWETLGSELANLSDEEQVKFFRGFINEIMQFGTHYKSEMQLLFIRDGLTEKQREFVATIGWDGKP